jgi:hypothetical protein
MGKFVRMIVFAAAALALALATSATAVLADTQGPGVL